MTTYKVVRVFKNEYERETIAEGLTLSAAMDHCKDPQTTSKTCTTKEGKALTNEKGEWFDSWYEE